jgi:hypothetical protein
MNAWKVKEIAKETGSYTVMENGKRDVRDVVCPQIMSKLIIEAGKSCEFYASDLLWDWIGMMEEIREGKENVFDRWFGFRQSGVDSENAIRDRMKNGTEYKAIYKVNVAMRDGTIYMTMYEMTPQKEYTVSFTSTTDVTIEATSPEEAKEKAKALLGEHNYQQYEYTYLSEIAFVADEKGNEV